MAVGASGVISLSSVGAVRLIERVVGTTEWIEEEELPINLGWSTT